MPLNDRVIAILGEEVGPSARVVLSRCSRTSLGKTPDDLVPTDLPVLADAVHAAVRATLGEGIAARIRQGILALR
ncbi:hypothetical protein [Methanofollis fontis]|nr:hypothetical protein [Methanofollis fontis]